MNLQRLDLNLLRALDTLLTECNITRASKQLHLSPSAVSGALARLREFFGDLLQMQVQAGELFAHLVRQHGFAAEIAMIRDHNHVSQSFSLNTGDDALSAPVERFLRQVL